MAGAGPAAPVAPPVPLSPARLSRLKRYDLDWQAALARLDTSKLSPAAAADLATLKTSIDTNLKQIEADALTMAQVMPALPFATKVVAMVEARIRVQDVDGRKAAETTTSVVEGRQVDARDVRVGDAEDGQGDRDCAPPTATDQLRAGMTEWFNFYNGYDPMFTWWMGMPYKQVDAALQDYATFLREKVAAADLPGRAVAVERAAGGRRRPRRSTRRCRISREIIALPQDEMRDVVTRFNTARRAGNNSGRTGGGRGGRRAARRRRAPAADAPPPPAPPDNAFYNALADVAEDARLRQAVAQRAGRLPLHQAHRRDRDRARRRS